MKQDFKHKYKIITCSKGFHLVDLHTGLSLDECYKEVDNAMIAAQRLYVDRVFEKIVLFGDKNE